MAIDKRLRKSSRPKRMRVTPSPDYSGTASRWFTHSRKGKSLLIEKLARRARLPVVTIRIPRRRMTDITGLPFRIVMLTDGK